MRDLYRRVEEERMDLVCWVTMLGIWYISQLGIVVLLDVFWLGVQLIALDCNKRE